MAGPAPWVARGCAPVRTGDDDGGYDGRQQDGEQQPRAADDLTDNLAASRLTDKAVARIVQSTALRAWLGELDLARHSMRAGFATSAAAAGTSERAIMKQTGHKSLPTVRRYIREGSLYWDDATDGLTM